MNKIKKTILTMSALIILCTGVLFAGEIINHPVEYKVRPTINNVPVVNYEDVATNSITATIVRPDLAEPFGPLALFYVSPEKYPNGFEIVKAYLANSASNTITITLQKFASPGDGSPSTIVAVSTSTDDEGNATPAGTDGVMVAGDYIMADLTTVVSQSWSTVTILYNTSTNTP